MTESRLLDQDKDEWFYHSMNKYSNLYMFDLEYPLDSLEIINETSLCVSGIQEYSKKCELLQLCVPPKLLRSEDEEGLCKDRDFKILSGGYADGRVRQIKFLRQSSNLIATSQNGYDGVVIYEVGDDNRATILEKQRVIAGAGSSEIPGKICTTKNRILMGSPSGACKKDGVSLYEWTIDDSLNPTAKVHNIWSKPATDLKPGHITKMKEWDDHTAIFLTSRGTVALYDLRTGSDSPGVVFHASKSLNKSQTPSFATTSSDTIVFSFDSIAEMNKIGIIDSCGGYQVFDPRFAGSEEETSQLTSSGSTSGSSSSRTRSTTTERSLLPDFNLAAGGGVYPEWFNIEYDQHGTNSRERGRCRFIISGVKKECVPVYEEVVFADSADSGIKQKFDNEGSSKQDVVASIFSHDGHSKPVTHSIWHPVANNLIFSASLDSVLHAWQFIPSELESSG